MKRYCRLVVTRWGYRHLGRHEMGLEDTTTILLRALFDCVAFYMFGVLFCRWVWKAGEWQLKDITNTIERL
uniref:Uncharacterized protein n=1 Tax=Manihot esculenta TaxID=3983 RepID=A0A2C9VZ21_MANES